MESQTSYLNTLSLSPYGKAIPYIGSDLQQEDGHANYVFKNLKAITQKIANYPGVAGDISGDELFAIIRIRPSPC